jgi:chromate transporter
MATGIIKEKRVLPVLIMTTSFIASFAFNVNIVIIILCCGIIGAIDTIYRGRKGGEKH